MPKIHPGIMCVICWVMAFLVSPVLALYGNWFDSWPGIVSPWYFHVLSKMLALAGMVVIILILIGLLIAPLPYWWWLEDQKSKANPNRNAEGEIENGE